MSRARYGDQRACECCGADIEFHGKPYRRLLIARPEGLGAKPLYITSGGWTDRGSGRFCSTTYRDRDGELVTRRRRLHRPAS